MLLNCLPPTILHAFMVVMGTVVRCRFGVASCGLEMNGQDGDEEAHGDIQV